MRSGLLALAAAASLALPALAQQAPAKPAAKPAAAGPVATVNGVEFYNDSKATNVDATIKALESFPANVHIILGGKDKGAPYTPLVPLLRERAKRVYTIGAAAAKIEEQLSGAIEIVQAGTLEVAVRRAAESARPGDIVVLAPACASFDQFDNYEHRGRVFKEAVAALAARLAAQAESH